MVNPDFGYVCLALAGISTQVLLHGTRFAFSARKVFDKDFETAAKSSGLLEEHKKVTGSEKLPAGGFPDTGNGRYSALLPYASWYSLNLGQRAHLNYVEGAASVLTLTLTAGLFMPKPAAMAAAAYMLGREVYAIGYTSAGAGGRIAGAIIFDLALLVLLGITVYGSLGLTGWIKA